MVRFAFNETPTHEIYPFPPSLQQNRQSSFSSTSQPRSILRRPITHFLHLNSKNAVPHEIEGLGRRNSTTSSPYELIDSLDTLSRFSINSQDKGNLELLDQGQHDFVGQDHSVLRIPSIKPPLRTVASTRKYTPSAFCEREEKDTRANHSRTEYLEMRTRRGSRSRLSSNHYTTTFTPASSSSITPPSNNNISDFLTIKSDSTKESSSTNKLCNYEYCKEDCLNWSKYCYKHQCRAFLCYSHVVKTGIAHCSLHHRSEDVGLVSFQS